MFYLKGQLKCLHTLLLTALKKEKQFLITQIREQQLFKNLKLDGVIGLETTTMKNAIVH